MDRFPARQRKAGHGGHPTYDLDDVWQDGHVYAGVTHASWVKAVLTEVADSPRSVTFFFRDRVEKVTLKWGEVAAFAVKSWGNVSVVSEDGAPLSVFWELTPGKAPS